MDDEITTGLKFSSRRIGWLYPVLLDKNGNIIDGEHRLATDPNWPKMKLEHVERDEDRLIARLVSNVCRRHVPAAEKRDILQKLGEMYVKSGVKPGTELAYKISEATGMSYRWVMKYLPDHLKERPGIGGPSPTFNFERVKEKMCEDKVARHATLQLNFLLVEPNEKVLTVKKYANVDFVQVILEGRFYANIEKLADKLGTTPEVILNNLLVSAVKKLTEISNSKKLREPCLIIPFGE